MDQLWHPNCKIPSGSLISFSFSELMVFKMFGYGFGKQIAT